jgi:hypothetical protein
MICLQTPTAFEIGGRTSFSHFLKVHGVKCIMQIEIHTAEPLLPGPNQLEIEMLLHS